MQGVSRNETFGHPDPSGWTLSVRYATDLHRIFDQGRRVER